jgi:hypothetical protein
MKRPWFRMHSRVKDDAKLQRLPPKLFKAWVNLCCIACEFNGQLPRLESIAYSLHTSIKRSMEIINSLSKPPFQLIDSDDSGSLHMHDWDEWQYQSDVSTERVRKFRESRGNVSETLHETFRNAEGETDQRQKQIQIQSTSTKTVEVDSVMTPPTNGSKPKRKLSPERAQLNAKLKAQQAAWFEEFKTLFVWKWEGEDAAWKQFYCRIKNEETWTAVKLAVVAQTREQMDREEQYRTCPTNWLLRGKWKDKPAPTLFYRPRDVI